MVSNRKGIMIIIVISSGFSNGILKCVVSLWVVKNIVSVSGNDY